MLLASTIVLAHHSVSGTKTVSGNSSNLQSDIMNPKVPRYFTGLNSRNRVHFRSKQPGLHQLETRECDSELRRDTDYLPMPLQAPMLYKLPRCVLL